jgi:glycosyltransferase involved in cell wall biosynthesis
VGNCGAGEWETPHSRAFDVALDDELRQFQPHIAVVHGFSPAERKRHARIRSKGTKLVLTISGLPGQEIEEAAASLYDASLCHSEWLAARHAEATPFRPVVLPPPVPARDVIPESREPVCATLIYPSRENGLYLLLRLAEQLSLTRPDDPILTLSSGAETAGQDLLKLGRAAGFDLGQYKNIMVADPAASPSEIWGPTQVFVAPVLANPPVTLIAEALVNGVPPVVGDRAAIPEILNGAGFALPLPLDYTLETRAPLPGTAVEAWVDLIQRLTGDDAFYAAESEKARQAGRAFDPAILAPRYAAFFSDVQGRNGSAA